MCNHAFYGFTLMTPDDVTVSERANRGELLPAYMYICVGVCYVYCVHPRFEVFKITHKTQRSIKTVLYQLNPSLCFVGEIRSNYIIRT